MGFRKDEHMELKTLIKNDIDKIKDEILNGTYESQKNLYILIVKGYRIEFPNIGRGISFSDTPDYKHCLEVLAKRLEMKMMACDYEQEKLLRDNGNIQSPVNVNVNNTNTSSSDNHSTNTNNNTNTTTVDLKAMFEEARKTIDDDESLNDNEVSEIIERINQLEELASSDENKRSKWNKCKEVMTWLFEKGAKVAGTILPLIIEIIK